MNLRQDCVFTLSLDVRVFNLRKYAFSRLPSYIYRIVYPTPVLQNTFSCNHRLSLLTHYVYQTRWFSRYALPSFSLGWAYITSSGQTPSQCQHRTHKLCSPVNPPLLYPSRLALDHPCTSIDWESENHCLSDIVLRIFVGLSTKVSNRW